MLLSELLNEAPIEDFNLVGDFTKSHSFKYEQDRKLLSNPKAVQKIMAKWDKTDVPFNMYFINMKGYGKFIETGEVTYDWLAKNMTAALPQIKLSADAVNILFTNNNGDERVPMTGWLIAHRLGHALARYGQDYTAARQVPEFTEIRDVILREVGTIFEEAYGVRDTYDSEKALRNRSYGEESFKKISNYESKLKSFYQHIGTFRSARTGEIRNEFEFTLELLAQFITTGSIKFNPLPATFGYGKKAWGKSVDNHYLQSRNDEHKTEEYNRILQRLARGLTDHYFPNLLNACVGRIFVM